MKNEQQTNNPELSGQLEGTSSTSVCNPPNYGQGLNTINFSGTTHEFGFWGTPDLIQTSEEGESVVMIYKQIFNATISIYPAPHKLERIFKIVYSCKDGKWHKSEPIFGRIIPATEEWFDFDIIDHEEPRKFTNEYLQSDGWEMRCYGYLSGKYLAYYKNNFSLKIWEDKRTNIEIQDSEGNTLFDGDCDDINVFATICKALKI